MANGHKGFLSLLDEMKELHCRKAADYGRGEDPLANCRASAELGIDPWKGVAVRLMDKVHRIKSFVANGKLENESVEDTLKDLAAYALIALVLYREQHGIGQTLYDHDFVRKELLSDRPSPPPARKRVYVAGPFSKGYLPENIKQACEAGMRLLKAGLAPFVPHLTCYMGQTFRRELLVGIDRLVYGITAGPDPEAIPCGTVPADWYATDLPWVAVSDAVLRLPGESTGADLEVVEARNRGIPVFLTVEDVIEHFRPTGS